ncbi:MAG: maltotransferase domain-containing protein [Burkholderia sp.]
MAPSTASPFSPHLYFVDARLVGPLDAWPAWFERIAGLGFDHVLIGAFNTTGRAGHPRVVADHDRPHEALTTSLDTGDALARLVEQAREFGLRLMLDVTVGRIAVEHPLRRSAPDWYVEREHDDARIDPRTAAFEQTLAYADIARAEVGEALAGWWHGRFATLSATGLAGFLVDAPQRLPAAWWRTWLGSRHGELDDVRWIAGIPGHAREALSAFEGAGFDGVFSSLLWWDLRAPWLVDEHALLRRVASPIAFPDAFDGPRLAHDLRGLPPDALERGYRRALETAAALGTGWLVPMGFERGVATPLMTAHPQPAAFRDAFERAPFDLSEALAEANRRRRDSPVFASRGELTALSGADAAVTVLLRGDSDWLEQADEALLIALNPELDAPGAVDPDCLAGVPGAFTRFAPLSAGRRAKTAPLGPLTLMPGDVSLLRAARAKPVKPGKELKDGDQTRNGKGADTAKSGKPAKDAASTQAEAGSRRRGRSAAQAALAAALEADRIAIERIEPSVDDGRFAAKRVVGEAMRVSATLVVDGHARLGAAVAFRAADEADWRELPLAPLGNDRWQATIPLDRIGRHQFRILAWRDDWGSLVDDIGKKHAAGQEIALELQEARALLAAALKTNPHETEDPRRDTRAAQALAKAFDSSDASGQLALLLAPDSATVYAALYRRSALTRDSRLHPVEVERRAARFGSWYEMFPRSAADDVQRHGSFEDVARHLPRIREMGFDVLYFPPIHPIGLTARKGRNNSLRAGPEDVGSPYAIGSPIGGHTELHPSLGTLGAFRSLVEAAHAHGIEIALDFAIQCSPDHPWLARHPGWFAWRPDGSLRFAENPPKRYQDIVNPDFYASDAMPELWVALRDVILHWVDAGVKLFRVDNPHAKPLPFWAWLIEDVRTRHPDVVFLSEAFTRPAMMYRLAKLGFSQSYTYFTWRESKHELREYLLELADGPAREFFRPNFFVNTPDINPRYLHHAPRAQFVIRAALAALLSGLWGMYSGFELGESAPLSDDGEEYRDAEKYELRARDWHQPGNLVAEIALLNRLRRGNPALQTHLGIRFLDAPNESVLVFRKATPGFDNVIVAAISLDPWAPQSTDFMLDAALYEGWGVPEGAALRSVELANGHQHHWHGTRQYVNLDPHALPFALWRIAPDAPRRAASTPQPGEGAQR